jgi:hypothetical protein
MWTIDGSYNHKDFFGRKHGKWQELFMNYEDTISGYRIGQELWTGFYFKNKKDGVWKYFKHDNTIDKIETYKKGRRIN